MYTTDKNYFSRYGDNYKIKHIEDLKFCIVSTHNCNRWSYADEGSFRMIDFSGGPYIEVGNTILHEGAEYKITNILPSEEGFVFLTEKQTKTSKSRKISKKTQGT